MTTKHTPGPWKACNTAPHGEVAIFSDHWPHDLGRLAIALAGDTDNPRADIDAAKANARLIAAPDLLEELKHALRFWDQLTAEDAARYRAVVEKAEGGAA